MIEQELENKGYDPCNLLGLERKSEHCEGKKERIEIYDHTGYTRWRCDCGHLSNWKN